MHIPFVQVVKEFPIGPSRGSISDGENRSRETVFAMLRYFLDWLPSASAPGQQKDWVGPGRARPVHPIGGLPIVRWLQTKPTSQIL